jgi:microcystin-dependent protein
VPIPDYITPGNPVEAVWGNDVIDALHDLQDLIDTATPIGVCVPYGGDTEPVGWVFARGQLLSRTTYSVLFARYGTRYGAGDGVSTFQMPDLRGRMPVGYHPGGTYWGVGLGEKAGSFDIPVVSHIHPVDILSAVENASHSHSGTTGGRNTAHAHNVSMGELWRYAPFNSSAPFLRTDGTGANGMRSELQPPGGALSGTETADHAHGFTTGTQSANHRHQVSGNTGSTGSTGVGKNIPPAQSFNFIIRAL